MIFGRYFMGKAVLTLEPPGAFLAARDLLYNVAALELDLTVDETAGKCVV